MRGKGGRNGKNPKERGKRRRRRIERRKGGKERRHTRSFPSYTYLRESGVSSLGAVKGGEPHESMHASLCLAPPVGQRPFQKEEDGTQPPAVLTPGLLRCVCVVIGGREGGGEGGREGGRVRGTGDSASVLLHPLANDPFKRRRTEHSPPPFSPQVSCTEGREREGGREGKVK
jgi:hypothetical protein